MPPVPSEEGDFSTLLRYGRNDEKGARRHRHLKRRIYEKIVSWCFILLPLAGEVPRSGKGGGERSEPITECLSCHVIQKANPVTATSYGQAPLGLEGSGASRRPGSIVPVLRTERWVRPTERAGSEGSFICRCLGQRKPSNRASLRGPPIGDQDRDGASYRCSAPYTLLPLRGISPQGETRK